MTKSSFLDGVMEENEMYDFCMCNPPFFKNDTEANSDSESESLGDDDHSAVGAPNEILFDGGEVEFVKNIIRESLIIQSQIK